MPSVGMRRSTRVFGARILRSGRRLWTVAHEYGKHVRVSLDENKFQVLLENSVYGGGDIDYLHKELWQGDEKSALVDITEEPKIVEHEPDGVDRKGMDRKCGIVYKRKRKRAELATTDVAENGRYAKKYVRKLWRRRYRASEIFRSRGCLWDRVKTREVALAVNGTSYECYQGITCLLNYLLSYMARFRIGMRQFSAFMLSKPILDLCSSCGMLFLQDPSTSEKPCFCIVTESASVIPLFSVNIFAIPPLFAYMQTNICFRPVYLESLLVRLSENNNAPAFQRDHQDCVSEASTQRNSNVVCLSQPVQVRGRRGYPDFRSLQSDTSCSNLVASANDAPFLRQSAVTFATSSLQNLQLKSSCKIQKTSSLRRKRGRPPSTFQRQEAKGALASELSRFRHEGRSTSMATEDASASSCSASLLITDSDKCYRVEGATIALESSASNQWYLTATKGGTKQCSLTAEKVMRLPASNRFTHDVIWFDNPSLKFEFPDKQDWLVFKELYKECSDRNIQAAAASAIPVPGAKEVLIPVNQHLPFVRPDSYITLKDNELTRALVNKAANYDMDSDDEEWLVNLNNELNAELELPEFTSPENFELVIDALEKRVHCNPEEKLDEQVAYDICMHLERKEVIDAVFEYWIRKRKKKRSALLRVFQLYQPRKSPLIPNFLPMKKRTRKQPAGRVGRGKQLHYMQAIAAAERDALEHKKNVHKLQEAKAVVKRNEDVATLKRQRAQMLMKNADLATYKAMMALKIAEAARVDEAPGESDS